MVKGSADNAPTPLAAPVRLFSECPRGPRDKMNLEQSLLSLESAARLF